MKIFIEIAYKKDDIFVNGKYIANKLQSKKKKKLQKNRYFSKLNRQNTLELIHDI